jgi:tetratricopeptide (TPR) repeat protein
MNRFSWRILQLCIVLLSISAGILNVRCTSSRDLLRLPFEKPRYDQIARARAEESFIMARDLERRRLFEEAEEKYREAYRLDPSSKVLRNTLVARYLDAGKFTPALVLIKGGKKNQELGHDDKRLAAEIYLRTRDFQKAIETIESIGDKSGADYYSLAVIYEAMGDNAKALKCYTAFFERNSVSLDMGLKIARMQMAQQQFKAADSLSSRLQQQFGDKAAVFNLRGLLSLARGDTSRALDFFNKAVAADSLFDEGMRNIALVYLQRNDYKNAISRYESLLLHSTKIFEEVYGRTLAVLYYYDRDYQKAEALLGKLCAKVVNDEELHYYLGLVYSAEQKNDLARIELEKSLSLRNNFIDSWRELVNLSLREHNTARALAVAERCTRQLPQNPTSWQLKGYALNLEKEYGQAAGAFLQATTLDSLDPSAWFDLGCSYERNKDIDRAAVVFEKVLKLKPGDAATLNYLGYMWADRGIKLDSAREFIKSALVKEPCNGAFLDSYAWVFFKMGNMDSAYCYMKKAIARMNDDPVIFEHLGDILCAQDRNPEAIEAFKKSIELNNETPDGIRQKIINLEPLPHHENP